MLYIEDVIEAFDSHLDEYYGPIEVVGHEFGASEALKTLSEKLYYRELDKYIEDNYTLTENFMGDVEYMRSTE